MTLEEVKNSYKSRIDKEKATLSRLKRVIFQVGTIRLVIVLACIAISYIFWSDTPVVLVAIGMSVVIYLFFMKYHNRLFLQKNIANYLF